MATISLDQLLEKVPPADEAVVNAARRRFNERIRAGLRRETGLSFPPGVSVPVSVLPGYPQEYGLIEVDVPSWLVPALTGLGAELRRLPGDLREVHRAVAQAHRQHDRDPPSLIELIPPLAKLMDEYQSMLREARIVEQILAVRNDILGVYRWGLSKGRRPGESRSRIELYWAVISLCARSLGVDVAGLAVKVLIHELAHAYTHLGSDIDGMTWRDEDFRAAEKPLVEGVAQYYTWCVLESISELHEARHAYEELVPRQPEAYQVHLPWTRRSDRERVRKAMLATRREGWRTLQEFAVSLGRGLG